MTKESKTIIVARIKLLKAYIQNKHNENENSQKRISEYQKDIKSNQTLIAEYTQEISVLELDIKDA